MEGFPLRMTGIVVGGLLGAAATMYLNRSNRTFSFSGMSSAGQALDNMVEKARSRMMDPDKRSYYGDNSGSSGNVSSSPMSGSSGHMSSSSVSGTSSNMGKSSSSTSGSGLDRVESIVKEDPMLKSQVNSILSENRDPATIR
jgi:hypothetical protein